MRDGKRLEPTETGFLVNDLVVEFFPQHRGYQLHLEPRG